MLLKLKNKAAGLLNRSSRAAYLMPRLAMYRFSCAKLPHYEALSASERALLKSPWYHDFGVLGVKTVQEPGIWRPNQIAKEKPLFDYIGKAVAACRAKKTPVAGIELFCADGFYGNYAVKAGADSLVGVDLDENNLAKARLMAKLLGHSGKASFEHRDVFQIDGTYDFGICAGGLYHISDPAGLLKLVARRVTGPLVIQTVYSLANSDPDYFETPAPGWTWGSRFSHARLVRMIEEAGWRIVESSMNELKANKRPEDMGSAYFLCTH